MNTINYLSMPLAMPNGRRTGLDGGRQPSVISIKACCAVAAMIFATQSAVADEGGVSFWLPGQQGSFAAVQSDPGWSLPLIYYHADADANRSKLFTIGGQVAAGVKAQTDLLMAAPTYVFSSPVAGAQASVGVTAFLGRADVSTDATLSGPGGGTLSRNQNDTRTGVGDLYPAASLKWNSGAHNFLAYTMAGVPVGAYDQGRLANLGTNHWSLDVGGGYTYFDPVKGHEASAVVGFTHNWRNPDTDYKNGVDGHLDWAASQFLSEQFHIGLVGYVYRQLTGDSGSGAVLGDFKSQVSAVGPQAGYFLKVGDQQWYLNLKGYREFDAKHRLEGWNMWLTLAIPLGSGNQ